MPHDRAFVGVVCAGLAGHISLDQLLVFRTEHARHFDLNGATGIQDVVEPPSPALHLYEFPLNRSGPAEVIEMTVQVTTLVERFPTPR